MEFLGYSLISDKELRRRMAEARAEERNSNNHLVERLLYNAEAVRRLAERHGIRIELAPDVRPGIAAQLEKNQKKYATKT